IGKGNLLLDLQKLQKNPIFCILVDIRQNTNFVRAFTTSANIRKGNLLLDLQKLQKNPIFRISVDIRQNINFVKAFTTSANVPYIHIQLFWNTLTHDTKLTYNIHKEKSSFKLVDEDEVQPALEPHMDDYEYNL
ncbi:hypothetical protein Tco_1512663, partial [Tanacetum coccineum]